MDERYRRNRHPHGTHEIILRAVPDSSTVLDAGCASGYIGASLVARGMAVSGFDRDETAVRRAASLYTDVRVLDLTRVEQLPWPEASFDVVIAADVLEHLLDSEAALRLLARYVTFGGTVIISVPNVAHASMRLGLLRGRFEYTDSGILDKTHTRFFTFLSASQLVRSAGLRVERVFGSSDRFGWVVNTRSGARMLRGLLAYGIVVVARRVSAVDHSIDSEAEPIQEDFRADARRVSTRPGQRVPLEFGIARLIEPPADAPQVGK